MTKLTKRSVEAAEIDPDRDYYVWDSQLKGFGVRIWPSGTRTYLVQYRAHGQQRRFGLGAHGKITADQARSRAKALIGGVACGDNPAEDRAIARRAPTVAGLCERFMTDHVAQRCKPRTQAEYRRAIDRFIKPAIGAKKIAQVTRGDIADLHHRYRDIPYQANRTLGVLSKLFSLAEDWELRPDGSNPTRRVKKYPEKGRERFLSAEEYRRLWATLDDIEDCNASSAEMRSACLAIRLLMLTGARLNEIITLEWSWIKDDRAHLPDSKTGKRKLFLPPQATTILDRARLEAKSRYVIGGKLPNSHLTDLQRPWRKIRREAGLDDVRIHDIRHSFASSALSAGESLSVIAELLGHRSTQTTKRYAHLADDRGQQAAAKVGSFINSHLEA